MRRLHHLLHESKQVSMPRLRGWPVSFCTSNPFCIWPGGDEPSGQSFPLNYHTDTRTHFISCVGVKPLRKTIARRRCCAPHIWRYIGKRKRALHARKPLCQATLVPVTQSYACIESSSLASKRVPVLGSIITICWSRSYQEMPVSGRSGHLKKVPFLLGRYQMVAGYCPDVSQGI